MSKNRPQPELSRPLLIDRVPRKGSHEHIVAEPPELLALAKRFDLHALHRLDARLLVTPWRGGGVKVSGTIEADVEQLSVVSLEPLRKRESFSLLRYFLPAKEVDDASDVDADPILDGLVDLGEITAETLGLELDPYPRKPDETFADGAEAGPEK